MKKDFSWLRIHLRMAAWTLKIYIHHYDPENKWQSMEYCHSGSPSVKVFKVLMSATKIMLTIFWDASGVLYTEFLTKELTMNSNRYLATLRSFKQRIRRNQTGKKHLFSASGQCQHFSTDIEVQAAVRKWIRSQPESFYMNGMKKWIEQWNKCVAVSVEK
ncbi:uncharacterized protein TNCV_429601 [Trichonephila clavipes]|nr:uncharacterized protein TNCV_429601 [Trichonephila clavipes]